LAWSIHDPNPNALGFSRNRNRRIHLQPRPQYLAIAVRVEVGFHSLSCVPHIFSAFVPDDNQEIYNRMFRSILCIRKGDLLRIYQTAYAHAAMLGVGRQDLGLEIKRRGIRHIRPERAN